MLTESEIIKPGDAFTYIFKDEGIYHFFSPAYPWIKGAIFVSNDISTVTKTDPKNDIDVQLSEGDKVKAVPVDYKKPESLKEALKNVDKLFLLTPDVPNAYELASNLVKEAKKAEVIHIVKQSIMGADLEADVGIMRLHRQAEKIIEQSRIPFTFLRPNEFMQNFVNFHSRSIKSNNAFYLPMEDAKVSVVDVCDIAAVAVKSLTENGNNKHNNKTYLITGPEALSYHQMAEILSNATGKKISYVNVSDH